MPWENPLILLLLSYCLAPIIALGMLGWVFVNIYRAIFGVPKQAIQSVERVAIARAVAGTIIETRRLENPDAHEKVVRTQVWAVYALVGLCLIVATAAGFLAGGAPGVILTFVDVVYRFYLIHKSRQGKNPKLIAQRSAKRLAARRVVKRKNGG